MPKNQLRPGKSALYYLLLLLAGFASRPAHAQRNYQQLAKLVNPPGTVLIGDSLWLDEAEVANIHWLEYQHFLHKDSTEAQYQAARPDTAAWAQLAPNDPYIQYYLRYPGFRYFPVVGVSYAQATRYCRWRSALVNQRLHGEEYLRKHPQLRNYDFRLEYRLPTVREWELAASGLVGSMLPYGDVFPPLPGSRRYRRQAVRQPTAAAACLGSASGSLSPSEPVFRMEFNVREHYYLATLQRPFNCPALDSVKRGSLNDGAMITEYVYAYPPNPRGLYNMVGNVAELTATPSLAKGGSFWQSVLEIDVRKNFPYTQPQMWLGFRCACTVYVTPRR